MIGKRWANHTKKMSKRDLIVFLYIFENDLKEKTEKMEFIKETIKLKGEQ